LAYQWKKLTVGFAIPNLLDGNTRIYNNQTKLSGFNRNYIINAPAAGDRFRLDNVSFGRNGSELSADSYNQLDKLVAYLKSHKNIRVRAAGYTDSRANAEHNGWLSRLRARAVADYLKSKGISPNRIEVIAWGLICL